MPVLTPLFLFIVCSSHLMLSLNYRCDIILQLTCCHPTRLVRAASSLLCCYCTGCTGGWVITLSVFLLVAERLYFYLCILGNCELPCWNWLHPWTRTRNLWVSLQINNLTKAWQIIGACWVYARLHTGMAYESDIIYKEIQYIFNFQVVKWSFWSFCHLWDLFQLPTVTDSGWRNNLVCLYTELNLSGCKVILIKFYKRLLQNRIDSSDCCKEVTLTVRNVISTSAHGARHQLCGAVCHTW